MIRRIVMNRITKDQFIEKIKWFHEFENPDDYKYGTGISTDIDTLNEIAALVEKIKNNNNDTINTFLKSVLDDLCSHILSDQLNQF